MTPLQPTPVFMLVMNEFTNDSRVLKEAEAMQAAGCAVTVVALHGADLPIEERLDSGVRVIRLRLRTRPIRLRAALPLKFFEFGLRALALMRQVRPAVVHCNDFTTLPIGVAHKRLVRPRARVVYDLHELWFEQHDYPPRPPLRSAAIRLGYALERALLDHADATVTVGPMLADHFGRHHGVPAPLVVRNIPQLDQSTEALPDIRERLGIPTSWHVAVYVGMLTAGRGLESLISAMSRVASPCALVLMGYGASRQALEQQAREAGLLGTKVFFHDPVAPREVLRHARGATIGVSLIENSCLNSYYCLPNKLFEYLSAGVPVLVSDLPEMAAFVRQHGVGEVMDPSSPQAVADAIDRLLTDAPALDVMRARALTIPEAYSWEKEATNLVRLYEALGAVTPATAAAGQSASSLERAV